MKKWIKWYCATIIALIAIFCSSCTHDHRRDARTLDADSAFVVKQLNKIGNPTFTNLDDVLTFQNNEGMWRHQDSVFFSIPPETLTKVYSVLEKRGLKITKNSLAAEYEDNYKVYSNLPTKEEEATNNGIPDIPNTTTVDTIINGKPVKLIVEQSTSLTNEEK